jgi:transposase
MGLMGTETDEKNSNRDSFTKYIGGTDLVLHPEDKQYFSHESRIIWFQDYDYINMLKIIYLDESLRTKEERDYLNRIATHPESYTLEEYHRKKDTFGTIALLTNLKNKEAEDIYQTYKSRMSIEVMFDGMKNVLDADHTYMQDQETLQGWMFVNHITLQWYQHLYIELKTKGMLKNTPSMTTFRCLPI